MNNLNHWTNENDTKKIHFKIQGPLAIEALKERESMAELAKRFELHPNQISAWKKEFLEHADQAFGGPSAAPVQPDHEKERDALFRKIGELEMHRDFLKKSLQKAGLWRNVKP